jgi:FkbM family methyltransferase
MTIKQSLLRLANRPLAPFPVSLEGSLRLSQLSAAETRLVWQTHLAMHNPDPETIPRAQLGQDLFVLLATSYMRGGYFVEFGAADGVSLSNTVLLERSFGWNGIVAEPAKSWHRALRENRRCIVDTRCVWELSRQHLSFAEPVDALLSTISDYKDVDDHRELRRDSVTYLVETVSLNDLLEEHSAPTRIDYLSLDTEGTEFEILRTFDFDRHDVGIITVEHAYDRVRRNRVHELLRSRGYTRVLQEISLWDDWYVNRTVTLPSLTS